MYYHNRKSNHIFPSYLQIFEEFVYSINSNLATYFTHRKTTIYIILRMNKNEYFKLSYIIYINACLVSFQI